MKHVTVWTLLLLMSLASASAAVILPWGPRAGFSLDPDQFVIGAHLQATEPSRGLSIQPNFDLGFGDDVTTLLINGDVVYTFPELESLDWGWYAGGGISWATYWFDGNSNGEIGLSILGGVSRILTNDNRLTLELRYGIDDIPEFMVTLGYWFF
jgi:hypothetical protein